MRFFVQTGRERHDNDGNPSRDRPFKSKLLLFADAHHTQDEYGYNIRKELISAAKNAKGEKDVEYRYQYDDIGNRISSYDLGTNRTYAANNLNQYTSISNSAFSASPREEFIPWDKVRDVIL